MFRGFNLIKRYYSLAGVKSSILSLQFIFLLIPALLSILSPILLSNIISSLTVFDFSRAIYFLSLDFLIIISSAIIYFLYHIVSRKINKKLFYNFNDYIYENIKKNKNIRNITLPTITNISVCINFNKEFLYKLCFLIKSIIMLLIIFYYNYIISLCIIFVSIISYLLLKITNKKIQNSTKHLASIEQKSVDLFNSIHKGSDIEENYNLNVVLKNKYFSIVEDQINTHNKISLFYSINSNFISLILKITVFIATIFLIGQIKNTFLTLSLYLILTPYLTSSAQNLISFFDLFSNIGNIDNILNEFESLKFEEPPIQQESFMLDYCNLYLFHISLKNSTTNIKDLNFEFNFGNQYLITSKNKNQILSLIDIITRKKQPSSGSMFINDKNSSDIKIDHYKKLITSTNSQPFFFNISIIENLLMISKNKKQILKIFKECNLNEIINSMPNKENTLIYDDSNKNLLFLLGVIRCYLSNAKIICIENLSVDLTDEYKKCFIKLLKFLKTKCTIILFSKSKDEELSFDKIFYI